MEGSIILVIIGILTAYGTLIWAKGNQPISQKKCPRCKSKNFQLVDSRVIGARDAEIGTYYKLNLNPLRPFTLIQRKEKVIRKASKGFIRNTFVCQDCGKKFT